MRWLAIALLTGCAGQTGDPITGDIVIHVGDQTITPSVGALIAGPPASDTNPATLLLVLGTRDISCDFSTSTPLHPGTYLTITFQAAARADIPTGMSAPFVSVTRVVTGGAHIDGATGSVTIDGVADRITGSVTFTTTNADVGTSSAMGSFDVTGC
jgi:hypothetical protein